MRRSLLALAVLAHAATARADAVPPRLARALQLDASGHEVAPRDAAFPRRYPRAPLLDRAREATGATLAWERFGTLGEGATVCVVDTGIDARHRDFLDAEGRTRVRWLVDLDGPARGEQSELEARHGVAIWSTASIDAALAAGTPMPGDRHGHGTAITSAAVGDDADIGALTPGPGAGIAPRASLIVVRALRDGALGFEDADVVRGVELCIALAAHGEGASGASRTVVLLSLGGHDGSHDGREPLERALSAIAEEGHAIVVAAGNDGARAIHASGRALSGAPARLTVHVPTPRGEGTEHWVALSIRSDAPTVTLRAIDGASATARDGEVVVTPHRGGFLLLDASAPREEGGRFVRAVIGGGGEHPALHAGDYVLELGGNGEAFDAWIIGAELGPALGAPALLGAHATAGESVTIPATSPALIAVGASISRDAHGDLTLRSREDGSASFSALGPSVLGGARPDLLAPGGFALAALSSDLEPGDEHNLLGGSRAALDRRRAGADRIAIEGTSVSAAIVAGAYALAYSLEAARPSRDRALLRTTAGSSFAWTASRGAGDLRIDRWLEARAAEDLRAPVSASRSMLSLTRSIALPRARDVLAVARVVDDDGRPVHGGELVVRTAGRELARATITHGHAETAITIDAAAGEHLVIDAEADGVAIAPSSIEIRIDEGTRGVARPGGGACRASGGGSGGGAAAFGALLVLVLAHRRRRGSLTRRR